MKAGTLFYDAFEAAKTVGMKPPKDSDTEQEYLKTLIHALSQVSDSIYSNMMPQTQIWLNKGIDAINAAVDGNPTDIPPLQGFMSALTDEIVQEEMKVVTDPPSTKEVINRFDKKGYIGKKPKRTGVMDAMRNIVLTHPDWPARKVFFFLRDNGWPNANFNSISVEAGNTRRVLELAEQLGLLKDKLPDVNREHDPQIEKINSSAQSAVSN